MCTRTYNKVPSYLKTLTVRELKVQLCDWLAKCSFYNIKEHFTDNFDLIFVIICNYNQNQSKDKIKSHLIKLG